MRALCDPHQLAFESITVGERPIAHGLAPVIDKLGTTQIVLGQAPQSWFDRLMREPLGSQLLRAHPEVEQHIVDVSHSLAVHEALETGLDAALIPGPDGSLRLRTGTAAEAAIRGIFFPDACTEFDHGYFVRTDCDRLQVVRIVDGVAMAQQQDTHTAELTAKLSGVTWRNILHLFDGSLPVARAAGTEVVSLR